MIWRSLPEHAMEQRLSHLFCVCVTDDTRCSRFSLVLAYMCAYAGVPLWGNPKRRPDCTVRKEYPWTLVGSCSPSTSNPCPQRRASMIMKWDANSLGEKKKAPVLGFTPKDPRPLRQRSHLRPLGHVTNYTRLALF